MYTYLICTACYIFACGLVSSPTSQYTGNFFGFFLGGSPYSSNSIMNQCGAYGSDYSQYSPFNKYSNNGPCIVDKLSLSNSHDGGQKNYLTYSILGNLMEAGKVFKDKSGTRPKYELL